MAEALCWPLVGALGGAAWAWGRAEASLVTVEVCTVMASCIRNSVTLLRNVEGGVSATEERLGVYSELHTSNVSFFSLKAV